jgi:mitochondrial fission protein ELM1
MKLEIRKIYKNRKGRLIRITKGAVKIMETKEIVELMLKSSDHNPYTGMLSKKDNLIAAIDLAKLCKDFADKGHMDEAMNIESHQWVVVISELEGMSLNCA